MVNTKESAPDSEEQKFKQKCNELRKRIREIEESNEISALALSRTRTSIRRLRLEYAILLERLEDQVYNGTGELPADAFQRPATSLMLDETISAKRPKAGTPRSQHGTTNVSTRPAKDPSLPKKNASAYQIFCDTEKERLRKEYTEQNPDSSAAEFSKTLPEEWKKMDAESRKPYTEKADADKERYQRELQLYNLRGASTTPASIPQSTDIVPTSSPVDSKEPPEAEPEGETDTNGVKNNEVG